MLNDEIKILSTPTQNLVGVNTPQFPGIPNSAGTTDAMIKTLQKFIRVQKRARGFQYVLPVGETTFNVELSGSARFLLGWAFFIPNDANTPRYKFLVNNEQIIQDVPMVMHANEYTDEEYYFFPRPLSGTDAISITINSDIAQTVEVIYYYI